MGADAHQDWRAAAASALEWWYDAGVDLIVDETPRDWLAAPAPTPMPASAPALPAATMPAATMPAAPMPGTLDAFLAWRVGADVPEAAWRGPAVPPGGAAHPRVMVLLDCPEREDGAAGLLAAGPAGRLFDRMLAAIGLDRAAIHLASTFVRRPPPGRANAEVEERLGAIARHHVALVRPERLLLVGNAASRAVLGTDMLRARGGLRALNHEGGNTGAVATLGIGLLLDRPELKGEAWKDLQMLVGGMDR